MTKVFKVGARGSLLSRVQTFAAMAFLREEFPATNYEFVSVVTPGDRDLTTPIDRSAPDFFTRDLDDAVRRGTIDFAIHSAKDLPVPMADDLDWFWLPCREDARDALVVRPGTKTIRKIGISSARREAWARKHYPKAQLLPIRGAIDSRIEQLRDGKFDAVLMALAGLNRLYPEGCACEVKPISLDELTPPEAQGVLAVVFRAGDARLMTMREKFVRAVRFVSGGVGSADLITVRGQKDLVDADVILSDDLLGVEHDARTIYVGKRCGAHSMKQNEITRLICDEARKGKRVVRLKGGDAGLFGRLAEETDALTALRIPFVVRPGVSALTAATTGTGMLLTRRGVSCGFEVMTPRSTGKEIPLVTFMSTRMMNSVARGRSKSTPCALVLDAAGADEEVRIGTLGKLPRLAVNEQRPGLFIVGEAAQHLWPKLGALKSRRMLVTCSEGKVADDAARAVEDFGGKPVLFPLIELVARKSVAQDVSMFDWVVLTSPSAAEIFFAQCNNDVRCLPRFATCGALTDEVLRRHSVRSDLMPQNDFSAKGLIAALNDLKWCGQKVLRLRSAKAGDAVAKAFTKLGARVTDQILYDNVPMPAVKLPRFDDVFFASASAVENFLSCYGLGKLRGKGIYVIGKPTYAALPNELKCKAKFLTVNKEKLWQLK